MARKATWTRAAPTRRVLKIYIVYLCIVHIMGNQTHIIVGSYKPDDLFCFFPCGTNPHDVFKLQVTWTCTVGRIVGDVEIDALITWMRGPPEIINARALNRKL